MSPCFGASSCTKVDFSKQLRGGKDTVCQRDIARPAGSPGTAVATLPWLPGRGHMLSVSHRHRRTAQSFPLHGCEMPGAAAGARAPAPGDALQSRGYGRSERQERSHWRPGGSGHRATHCPAPFPSPWDALCLAQPATDRSGSPASLSLQPESLLPSPMGARCCCNGMEGGIETPRQNWAITWGNKW